METKPKIVKVEQLIRINKYHVILILALLVLGIVQFVRIAFDVIATLANWLIGG